MEHTDEMNMLLDRIPCPAFIVQEGKITLVNELALQRQFAPQMPILDLLLTGREEYAAFTGGCLYLTMDCCGVPSSVSITPLKSDLHLFILEQEEDLEELQSMALAAQALRGPLSNVMTVADQLFPMINADDAPLAQDQIARINRGLFQMLRIISNMSDTYRYGTEQNPRTELLEVNALVREIIDQTAPLLPHVGIELRFEGLTEPLYCLIDSEKLERAIHNLIANAVKFSPKGKPIHARLFRRGRMLYFSIQDNGSGIPGHLRSSLYNRYQRQPGIEDSRFGIGLGMVLVRRAAAAHGGTLLTEEGTDFGLRVTMTIPIRQITDPNVRSPMIHVDYAGERSHALIELSDCLPPELYRRENIN